MNRKIGIVCSLINLLATLGFAVSMLFNFDFGSYFCSMFIAISFVGMMCCFLYFAALDHKVAGYAAVAFATVYAAIIMLVYFAQLTTVRTGSLTDPARELLDFQQMSLFFCFDQLGYAIMALSTFFAGLTVWPKNRTDKWLRMLLLIHGIFFISCLILPMTGIFQPDSPAWIGVTILEVWCIYFCLVAFLAFRHFCQEAFG